MARQKDKLTVFPVFLRVENRTAVVVGDGPEAAAKVRLLQECAISIRLVSATPDSELAALVIASDLEHVPAQFRPSHIEGAAIVFAATGDEPRDQEIVAAANRLSIPVNAVDRPKLCDFFTPALVNRAPIAVAISSEGSGPVLTQLVRSRIEALLPRSTGDLARLGALYRVAVDRLVPRGLARRQFWRSFFDGDVSRAVEAGDLPSARRAATRLLKGHGEPAGSVAIIEAGIGEADLLTLRAVRAMQLADAIWFDAGVSHEVVKMGRRDAERHSFVEAEPGGDAASRLALLAAQGRRIAVMVASSAAAFRLMRKLTASATPFEHVPGLPGRVEMSATIAAA